MESPRLMIVIDEGTSHFEMPLSEKDCDIILAERGFEVLEILAATEVDLVLMDMQHPGKPWEDLFSVVRMEHPGVPVLVLSPLDRAEPAMQYLKGGAYEYLLKPIGIEGLSGAIREALERSALEKSSKYLERDMVQALIDFNTERKRLKTIINTIPNGVMVTNEELEVVLHNPALMRLLGLPLGIKPPVPVSDIIHDPGLIEMIREIYCGGRENERLSMEIALDNRTMRAISAPVLGPDKNVFWKVVGSLTVLEDISDFKNLDQMKTDFVNMVVHELRSPLVGIRQLNSVLLEGLAGPLEGKALELIEKVKNKTDALLCLINDLLDMAKMESGKHVQHFVPVDMDRLIRDATAFFQPRAEREGVSLSCLVEPLRPVLADPKNIDEILSNLISNSINYSPGGSVAIKAKCVDKFVEISVEDTGVGIPPDELPKIFDKFYRVKHPKTRYVQGTGLGLPIVKGIVEAHNGRIDVKSVPGKGTCFMVYLPLTDP